MAHPRRKEWAEKLAKELECPIAWDEDFDTPQDYDEWTKRRKIWRESNV